MPLRAPAPPNTPPRRTRRRARAHAPELRRSLQPSGSFRLHPSNAPSDAEGPAPPARLPEVAGPKLGAGLRAVRAVLGSSLPARGFGEETVSGLGPHVHVRGAERDPLTMARPQPLALQLEQLLNPRPREADPEADPEEGEA